MLKICIMIKSLANMGIKMNPTSMGSQIYPRCQPLMNMGLLVVNFFYHSNNMMEICLMIKSLAKLGITLNLKNMERPINPIYQFLLNMIFLVTHSLYYPNKMTQMTLLVAHFFYYLNHIAASSSSIFLQ